MLRIRKPLLAILACAMLTSLGGSGVALADGPQNGPSGGWLPDPSRSGPGTTSTYAAQKAADFASFVAARSSQVEISPSESYMLFLNEYHQKTTYYCLVAAIQSLLNTYFGGYVTGGIAAGQNAIATATNTTTGGTYNGPAISYTNQQISKHPRTPSDWLYVSSTTTSATQLWNRVLYDVGYGWPTYVMVNWNSTYWPDHGHGDAVGHATLAYGWADPSTIDGYDPWSYLKSDRTCYFGPNYTSTPDRACYVQLSSSSYYQTTIGGWNIQWY